MEPEKSKSKNNKIHKTKKPVSLSITKQKFDEVMELINDKGECDTYFQPRCSVPVQNITSTNRNSFSKTLLMLLEEARFCVMQRDWKNLAKILTFVKPDNKQHVLLFPVFVRYAAIYLAHNPDENLMDTFMVGVAGCKGEPEKEQFLKSLTNN